MFGGVGWGGAGCGKKGGRYRARELLKNLESSCKIRWFRF